MLSELLAVQNLKALSPLVYWILGIWNGDLELENFAVEEEIFVESRAVAELAVMNEELVEEPHADGQVPGGGVAQSRLELGTILPRRLWQQTSCKTNHKELDARQSRTLARPATPLTAFV